jgi:hypothetical protein
MNDFVGEVNDENFGQVALQSSVQGVSSWQLIFQQSKVNNGPYDGDRLPAQNWHWPQGTWLQTRLRYLRKGNGTYSKELSEKIQ